jgi:hypothetical protein
MLRGILSALALSGACSVQSMAAEIRKIKDIVICEDDYFHSAVPLQIR